MDTTTTNAGPNGTPPAGHRTGAGPRLIRFADLVDDLVADAERRTAARTQGVARGPVTGLPSLDELLGGCLEPGLHVLHGGPGVGKSAMALQLGGTCGCPAVYVSAEMDKLELFRRLIARTTSTYLGDLKTGAVAPATVRDKARAAVAKVPGLALIDATDAYADPDYLHAAAVGVRGDAGHVLLLIDSVHSWSAAAHERELSEYDRLGAALEALRALARRLAAPLICVAERNRLAMRDGGISASAGHRGFEYACESMVALDKAESAQAPSPGEVVVTAKVAKNRHGPGHDKGLKLAFNGGFQRFSDLEAAAPWGAR